MKNDRDVYFQSERTGYSQLYTVSFDGGEPKALTSGKWEVDGAILVEDKSRFFLTTSEGDRGRAAGLRNERRGRRADAAHLAAPGGHTLRSIARRSLVRRYLFLYEQAAGIVRAGSARRRDGEEADIVARARLLGISVAGRAHRHVPGARWRNGAGAVL